MWKRYSLTFSQFSLRYWALAVILLFGSFSLDCPHAQEMITIPTAVLDQIEEELNQQKIRSQNLFDSAKKINEQNLTLIQQNQSLTLDIQDWKVYCEKQENQVKLLKAVAWILGGATVTLTFLEVIRSFAK